MLGLKPRPGGSRDRNRVLARNVAKATGVFELGASHAEPVPVGLMTVVIILDPALVSQW